MRYAAFRDDTSACGKLPRVPGFDRERAPQAFCQFSHSEKKQLQNKKYSGDFSRNKTCNNSPVVVRQPLRASLERSASDQ